ncbi:hypothetical protein PENTCL1PPCAC_29282, partial [Pristionchus entomophagus]
MENATDFDMNVIFYAIFHKEYQWLAIFRDSGGLLLMTILVYLTKSDPILSGRYKKDITFVKFIIANRIAFVSRDFLQSRISEEAPISVAEYFCPLLLYGMSTISHTTFAYTIYLSMLHFQRARRGRMFTGVWWMAGTALFAVLLFACHAVL